MIRLLEKRFGELELQAKTISATEKNMHSAFDGLYPDIDADLILGWCVKARNLLSTVCGRDSEHYRSFLEAEEAKSYENSPTRFRRVVSVFSAAKEDFEGGYVVTMRNLVQADVFTDELQQADELLRAGYHSPAAVIAGVVLETAMRDCCVQKKVPPGKLSKMNEDLAKAGYYNSIVQKQVTALSAIRNSAAHGKNEEFSKEDVAAMLRDVERLVGVWLS